MMQRRNKTNYVILIDDDDLVHLAWGLAIDNIQTNICLVKYYRVKDFMDDINSYPKDSRIYIDSNLGDNVKGEIESAQIYNAGFSQIYLATGYLHDDIEKPSWIKAIVGKSPPIF